MNNRITSLVMGILLLVCAFNQDAKAQYIMGESESPIIDCDGTIESFKNDSGLYINNLNITTTICSGNAQCLQLTFTEFSTQNCCDYLEIYDGDTVSTAILRFLRGDINPGTIYSTANSNGCLTLRFTTSSEVVSTGFKANFSCVPCPPVYILGQGSDSIIACNGNILDPGGQSFYANNENKIQTYCNEDTNQCLSLIFASFNTELNTDILTVYDGPSINSTLLGTYSGETIPFPVTSTIASGGCLTLAFTSNSLVNDEGFTAILRCGNCQTPSFIIGQNDSIPQYCGNYIFDSGFLNTYGNNQHFAQTFCSDSPDQCISLTFSLFSTEAVYDRLLVYDGQSTAGDLLAVCSGSILPEPITSTVGSGGCLTLVFNSNETIVDDGFMAQFFCGECHEPTAIPSEICSSAQPLCTELAGGYTFSAPINTPSENIGNAGCLGETNNAVWYSLQIQDPGSIDLFLTSAYDVDFICWGPFDQTYWNTICDSLVNNGLSISNSNIVDCSFSIDNFEHCLINNAVYGEYYMLMATNYSNINTFINIQKIEGAGTTSCIDLCDSEINYTVSNCDSSNNTYSINGTLYIPHPPMSGNFYLTNSSGGLFSYESPFPDSVNFSFNLLASEGQQEEIQLSFSDALNCNQSFFYSAPAGCNTCVVNASTIDSIHCHSFPINLMATEIQGAEYSWTGPNGFISTEQNPIIPAAEFSMSGTYQVNVYNPLDSCLSIASVNVIVQPYPDVVNITGNIAVCSRDSLVLHVSQYPDAEYTWYKSGNVYSHDSTLAFQPAITNYQGFYSCSININGCVNSSQEVEVVIYPVPYIPLLTYHSLFNSLHAYQANWNYQWFFNDELIPGQIFDTLKLELPGYYKVVVTNEFGCSTTSYSYFFNPTGIPELSISRLALQPNPASDIIQVSVPESGVLNVHDLAGKLIKEMILQSGIHSIHVDDLAEGNYLFQFRSNSSVRIAKVIVEHN